MHQTRTKTSKKLPISRKGTKYVARAASHNSDGVSIIVAIRDMLELAKTAKEVKAMVNQKSLKINGKVVRDVKESVRLFNVLEADKSYCLTILPSGRFVFEETKKNSRLCKVVNKTTVQKNKIQLNLHDGSNVILDKKEKVSVGDSLELDFNSKIQSIIPAEKGKDVFVVSGRSVGLSGKVKDLEGKKVTVDFKDKGKEVVLDLSHVIAR